MYNPDPIWSTFGIKTQEDYLNKYVLKGYFHSGVHPDVVEAYKTVEVLLSCAYYHYKLMDVALSQLMGLFEMAVKFRCEEVGINLHYFDKNGKKQSCKLNSLIDQLIKKELTIDLKAVMHNVRQIRNYSAHPNRNDTIGTIALRPILVTVNLINQLYLSKKHHVENKAEFERFRKVLAPPSNQLFLLSHGGKLILVHKPILTDTFKMAESWIRAVSFNPVLINTKRNLLEYQFPDGIVRFFKDVSIVENGIKAYDIDLQKDILIEQTTHPDHLDGFNKYVQELNELQKIHISTYNRFRTNEIDRKIQLFIYKNCWNNLL